MSTISGARWPITPSTPPRHWPLLEDGRCIALVALDYGRIGSRAVNYCITAVRDPSQEKRDLYIPLRAVPAATLDAYRRDWADWIAGAATLHPRPPDHGATAAPAVSDN